MNVPPLVYDVSTGGHRARDATVIAKVVGGTVLFDAPNHAVDRLVGHAGPVVWQTADYAPVWFTAVAVLRALRGHRTVGICYRNNRAVDRKPLRRAARQILFWMWNVLPSCTALTVCPPAFGSRSSKFMYDTEWWDLVVAPLPIMSLPSFAGTRKTLMFLGDVSELKGTSFFIDCAVAAAQRKSNWHFVLVGLVDGLTSDQRTRLSNAGATLIPGPKEDAAFVSYIREADLLWCCYDPIYDQSSGIFGRALQLRKATIVRAGSILHEHQRNYSQGIAVSYGDTAGLLAQLDQPIPARDLSEKVAHMYGQASSRLKAACE